MPSLVRERKFVSDRISPEAVASVLRLYCVPDGKYPSGELESIYFDDPFLSSYWEKANGDALKRKVRIRWYRVGADAESSQPAFLEVKDRIGAARDKSRFSFLARPHDLEDRGLHDPWYGALLREKAGLASFGISQSLVPTVSIRYRRMRWICQATQSRVSIDYNIACTRFNQRLFPSAIHSGPIPLTLTICEAKSSSVRSWPFGEDLQRLGMRMESFSKYGHFISVVLQGGFS